MSQRQTSIALANHRMVQMAAMSLAMLATAFVTMLATARHAHADQPTMTEAQMLPKYRQECAGCHMAYPPGFLSKSAWTRIMSGLEKHYGSDASLDEASVREISKWLGQHAGSYKRVTESSPQDRITTTVWFERKHREIKPEVFKRASIKSPANCAACHVKADQGNFSEDFVRIPK